MWWGKYVIISYQCVIYCDDVFFSLLFPRINWRDFFGGYPWGSHEIHPHEWQLDPWSPPDPNNKLSEFPSIMVSYLSMMIFFLVILYVLMTISPKCGGKIVLRVSQHSGKGFCGKFQWPWQRCQARGLVVSERVILRCIFLLRFPQKQTFKNIILINNQLEFLYFQRTSKTKEPLWRKITQPDSSTHIQRYTSHTLRHTTWGAEKFWRFFSVLSLDGAFYFLFSVDFKSQKLFFIWIISWFADCSLTPKINCSVQ